MKLSELKYITEEQRTLLRTACKMFNAQYLVEVESDPTLFSRLTEDKEQCNI